jgi:hypothetical protein
MIFLPLQEIGRGAKWTAGAGGKLPFRLRENVRALRKAGVTVRKTIHTVIATREPV